MGLGRSKEVLCVCVNCNVARLIDQLMTLLEIDSRKKSRENKKEYFQIVFWFWGKEEERERK